MLRKIPIHMSSKVSLTNLAYAMVWYFTESFLTSIVDINIHQSVANNRHFRILLSLRVLTVSLLLAVTPCILVNLSYH